jgi:4a-hydroxytetrahydrobiopterin dehydratase
MPPTLSQTEITEALATLPGWTQQDNAIVADFTFRDFSDALIFVNSVAQAAEEANHHPDIDIRYNRVRMLLTSHDSGGITRRDTRMAKQVTEIYSESKRTDFGNVN